MIRVEDCHLQHVHCIEHIYKVARNKQSNANIFLIPSLSCSDLMAYMYHTTKDNNEVQVRGKCGMPA